MGAQARVDASRSPRCWSGTSRSRGGSATASSTCRSTASTATCAPARATRSRTITKASPATAGRSPTSELLDDVCRFANGLRKLGIKNGDRVAIYMPMIPELPVAMLACARIGAAHSVIFGGFSPDSIVDRVNDAAVRRAHHRRPRLAARQQGAAQAQLRHRDGADAVDQALHRRQAHRRRRLHARGPRRLVGRRRRRTSPPSASPSAMNAEDLLYPALHERHDGQTQGHQTHHRRLSDARHDDAQARLRSQGRRATSTGARPTSAG